jgi:predicted nucleic acid-binding protein
VIDAIETIRNRLPNARFVIVPAVFQELVHIALNDPMPERRSLGTRAVRSLKGWHFDLLDIVLVGQGIVETVARRIRAAQLLPEEEVHDSIIMAEAALFGCTVLLTSDSHLRAIDLIFG